MAKFAHSLARLSSSLPHWFLLFLIASAQLQVHTVAAHESHAHSSEAISDHHAASGTCMHEHDACDQETHDHAAAHELGACHVAVAVVTEWWMSTRSGAFESAPNRLRRLYGSRRPPLDPPPVPAFPGVVSAAPAPGRTVQRT